MTKLVVGCPALKRNWILPTWKEYLDEAIPDDFDVEYVFNIPAWDLETMETALDISSAEAPSTICVSGEEKREDVRDWINKDRYNQMVEARNGILRKVRIVKPDYFLSIDSDILINPDALIGMIEHMSNTGANAVAGLTYLDPSDKLCTNAAIWKKSNHSAFKRAQVGGMHEVDVIMALKLMDNLAYNVNYEYHDKGEDFGWSIGAKRAGAKLFFDGRNGSKHVMDPTWLDRVDKRVGY